MFWIKSVATVHHYSLTMHESKLANFINLKTIRINYNYIFYSWMRRVSVRSYWATIFVGNLVAKMGIKPISILVSNLVGKLIAKLVAQCACQMFHMRKNLFQCFHPKSYGFTRMLIDGNLKQ